MAENLTKIGSNYDMIELMQKIGSNYFDDDLSMQRIGMFGFTVESLGNMFGAAILDASNRQQEYNVYTASRRSTLLYEGSRLDVNIDNAKPAKMTAYLGILVSSLINTRSKGGFGTPDPNSIDSNHPDYKLVIEKDMVINIADYSFMVEHDILIKATYNKSSNTYTYSVQYLLDGDVDTTSYSSDQNYIVPRYATAYPTNDKYIQSYLHNYAGGISMLLFKVELVQLTKETKTQPIIKNDIVSLTGIDFNYSNNLSHFNVFYRRNNSSSWENITTVPIYNSDEKFDENVIFYEVFHDEKKIRLNITDFKPDYNSEIRVDIYTTIGSEVNDLEYSGDGSDISITLNTLDERHSYTGLELNCKPISSCAGAFDVPTLEELRARVIRARATANSIDANYDLINFMESKDDSNDYVFIKKRNDIIERRYSCYMIPRLTNSDIIPSSTLDLAIVNFRDRVDTSIPHYEFTQAKSKPSYTDDLYYKEGLNYIGSKPNNENYDSGVTIFSIGRVNNNITNNTNLDALYIPLNGIYSSDVYQNSYSKDNPRGITKSSSFMSLYSYLSSISDLNDYITPNHTLSGTDWQSRNIPNNIISSIDKFTPVPIINKNITGKYYYNIKTKSYINEVKTIIDDTNVVNYQGALKNKLYTVSTDLDGLYIDSSESYVDPLNDVQNYAFVKNTNGLYQMYKTKEDELVFVKVRVMENGIIRNIYTQDTQNPYLTSSDNTANWSRVTTDYYTIIELTSDVNFDYVIKSEDIFIDSNNKTKLVSISNNENSVYSAVMVSKTTTFENRGLIQYEYYSSPYKLQQSNSTDQESFYLDQYVKFGIPTYSFSEYVANGFNNYNGNENILTIPEQYYSNINEYSSSLYYQLDRNVASYKKSSFVPMTTLDVDLNKYFIEQYQYYDFNKSVTETEDYLYMYFNSDNITREFIPYKSSIKISDIIVYKPESIKVNNKNNYDSNYDTNFGYFITLEDETHGTIYRTEDLYIKERTTDNTEIGEYVFDSESKTYVKDISSTAIKGITYNTNNAGDRVSITIKAGTPFALIKDIITNSDDEEDFIDIIQTTEDSSHECDDNCTCNASTKSIKPSYKDKFNKSIFDSINGTDTVNPKAYYQYPIQSARNHYSISNGFTEDGYKFYKKNSLLPINRYETTIVNDIETDKFHINKDRGIYMADTNESLEDYIKVYTSPYTITYDIENQISSFFLTSINKNIGMSLIDEESNTPVNFSIDTINIYRNPIDEYDNDFGTYKITVDLMANGDISNATFISNDGTYINSGFTKNSIMIKGFIYDTSKMLRGWVDFTPVEIDNNELNIFRFEGELRITDELSETYCTTMKNFYSLDNLDSDDSSDDVTYMYKNMPYTYISSPKTENYLNLAISDLTIGIGCYVLDRTTDLKDCTYVQNSEPRPIATRFNNSSSSCISETVTGGSSYYPIFVNKCTYAKEVRDDSGTPVNEYNTTYEKYILTNVYMNTSDKINIYTDMSNYVKSSVSINPVDKILNKQTGELEDVTNYEVLHFTDVPVVKHSQCFNTDNFSRISNTIINAHENLTDLSYNITNNFSVDFKFFRTYGPCRYFKLGKPNQDDSYDMSTTSLGNLDIDIVFSLLIKPNLSISDADVVNQLKLYIKERIESLNVDNADDDNDYTIYLSNIITDIENEFNDYVRSIELVSINGFDSSYRIIYYDKPKLSDTDYTSSLSTKDVKEYVPEYINVPLSNITIKVRR